jgi:hypothetical protein
MTDIEKRNLAEVRAGVSGLMPSLEKKKNMPIFKNWKPKTVAGKVLKGAAIGIGGATLLATGVGAAAGVIGGGGLLAGAAGGVGTLVKGVKSAGGGVKTVLSKVSAGATKLLTGQSKEELAILKEAKSEAKEAKSKIDLVKKLQKTGLSEAEARIRAGLSFDQLPKVDGVETKSNNMLMYAGLGLAALFLLPKLLKR